MADLLRQHDEFATKRTVSAMMKLARARAPHAPSLTVAIRMICPCSCSHWEHTGTGAVVQQMLTKEQFCDRMRARFPRGANKLWECEVKKVVENAFRDILSGLRAGGNLLEVISIVHMEKWLAAPPLEVLPLKSGPPQLYSELEEPDSEEVVIDGAEPSYQSDDPPQAGATATSVTEQKPQKPQEETPHEEGAQLSSMASPERARRTTHAKGVRPYDKWRSMDEIDVCDFERATRGIQVAAARAKWISDARQLTLQKRWEASQRWSDGVRINTSGTQIELPGISQLENHIAGALLDPPALKERIDHRQVLHQAHEKRLAKFEAKLARRDAISRSYGDGSNGVGGSSSGTRRPPRLKGRGPLPTSESAPTLMRHHDGSLPPITIRLQEPHRSPSGLRETLNSAGDRGCSRPLTLVCLPRIDKQEKRNISERRRPRMLEAIDPSHHTGHS